MLWIVRCTATPLLLASTPAPAGVLARDALWSVVRTCQSAKASIGVSLPCLDIRRSEDGYSVALLRPLLPTTHLLVVPTERITGIESPALRGPAGAAYLAMAWGARDQLGGEAGAVPWGSVGMAINSPSNRSQDQLHIHVDCLTPRATASLAKTPSSLGDTWRLLWRGVWARLVRGPDLRAANPLGGPLEQLPLGPAGLGGLNFGVVGTEGPGGQKGFVLLASKTMSFERLLDPTCTDLQPRTRTGEREGSRG